MGDVESTTPENFGAKNSSPKFIKPTTFSSPDLEEAEEAKKEEKRQRDLHLRIRSVESATNCNFNTPDDYIKVAKLFYQHMKEATHEI